MVLVNGAEKVLSVANLPEPKIWKALQYAKNNSGLKGPKANKAVVSDTPSVRGLWSPFHSAPHTFE
jgi:large subunit ribosomal protein L43